MMYKKLIPLWIKQWVHTSLMGYLVYHFVFSPKATLALLCDLYQWKKECNPLVNQIRNLERQHLNRKRLENHFGGKPTVLLVISSNNIYEVKLLSVLSKALEIQGWSVVVFLGTFGNPLIRLYLSLVGFTQFYNHKDFKLNPEEEKELENEIAHYEKSAHSVQDLKSRRFKGAWIGPQILASISRQYISGIPKINLPDVQREIVKLLPNTLRSVYVAEQIVKKLQPSLGLIVEANYSINGPLVDKLVENKVGVIQVTQPNRDDALMLFRLTHATRRMHPSSVTQKTLEKLCKTAWTESHERQLFDMIHKRYDNTWVLQKRNQINTYQCEKTGIIEMLKLDPKKKIVVIFSHVLWDANLFYGDDLFDNYGVWFIETLRSACSNPAVNWLVKLHPVNVWKRTLEGITGEFDEIKLIEHYIGPLPPHVVLLKPDTNISSLSLFKHADFGVTVRGTAGMEMSCFGKPVFTAGTGRYSGLGFTIDSQTIQEYKQHLANIHEAPPLTMFQWDLAKRHAFAAFIQRPWVMENIHSSFNYRHGNKYPLFHNLHLKLARKEKITELKDLNSFAKWAEDADSIDYLTLHEGEQGVLH